MAAKYSYSRERKLGELEEIIKDASKGEYPNYAAILKAQEMICKMLGFFEPEKQEINNYDVNISVLDGNAHPPRHTPLGTHPHTPAFGDRRRQCMRVRKFFRFLKTGGYE